MTARAPFLVCLSAAISAAVVGCRPVKPDAPAGAMASAPPPATDKADSKLAMIALARPALPPAAALVSACTTRWGAALPVSAAPGEGAAEAGPARVLLLPKGSVMVGLMDFPIPAGDLEGPIAAARWHWPEASETLRAHTAHLVVFLNTEAGAYDVIDRHLLLTRALGCLLETTDAIGVYWGDGRVVASRAYFQELTKEMGRDDLPLPLWIAVIGSKGADGRLTLGTQGMAAFDRLDFVATSAKPAVIGHLYGLSHYVITSGARIADGHTVGLTAEEKLPVRHRPSPWDPSRTVIWFELP